MPFEIGNKQGNGKPRETRNRLTGVFLKALLTSFEQQGVKAIDRVIRDEPAQYLRVIASIIPKELEINNNIGELTDEQLAGTIAALRSAISAGIVREATEAPPGPQPAKDIPPIH